MTKDNRRDENVKYIPYHCRICTGEEYSGKLRKIPGKVPICDNHTRDLKSGRLSKEQIVMVPVQ